MAKLPSCSHMRCTLYSRWFHSHWLQTHPWRVRSMSSIFLCSYSNSRYFHTLYTHIPLSSLNTSSVCHSNRKQLHELVKSHVPFLQNEFLLTSYDLWLASESIHHRDQLLLLDSCLKPCVWVFDSTLLLRRCLLSFSLRRYHCALSHSHNNCIHV